MEQLTVGCVVNRFAAADAATRREMIDRADAVGLDHLGFGDHVSFRTGAGADGLLAAAGVLSVSDRLSSNTGVYLLPLRHPVVVARQLADLAVMAPGRFVFGVGIGGEDPHEIQSCGVDPSSRGRRMDEALHIVRELLTGAAVDYDGQHFALRGVQIAPAPAAAVPIIVGGRSDAAIHRAGRFGDGWFGIWVSPQRFGSALEAMSEAAAAIGRPTPELNALNVWCGVGSKKEDARAHVSAAMQHYYGIPYDRFERWSPAGTPDEIAAFLVPYVAAGCTLFNLIVSGRDSDHEIEAGAQIRATLLEMAAAA